MNENQNKPEENLPGKAPENIQQPQPPPFTETKATESSTNQPPQEMEVHHHGHVPEKKKWKEYIFQFLMLFLAVFLGFWSENLREKRAEKNIEREYIESLVTDLSSDNDIANRNAGSIFEQVKRIDTLQGLFFSVMESGQNRDSLVKKCYQMSLYLSTFYSEFFNERTITQLLSSGSMRLIKKQGVADSIMDYHSFIKFVEMQKQLYVNSINAVSLSMYNVYDISFLKSYLEEDVFYIPSQDALASKLLTTNPAVLKNFIATLENTKIVAFTYKNYLVNMMDKSNQLYKFLRKSYDIKD